MTKLPTLRVDRLFDREEKTKLLDALNQYGFFYLEDPRAPLSLIKSLLQEAKVFFEKPLHYKMTLAMEHAGLAWRGYFPVGQEYTKGQIDQKEGLYFGLDHPPHHPLVLNHTPTFGQNLYPKDQPLLAKGVKDYMSYAQTVSETLLSALFAALSYHPEFLSDYKKDPTIFFRIFAYPAGQKEAFGVHEHTDMGFLTLLYQDQWGGLEAKTTDGSWLPVPPREDAFVINIGDMLEYYTYGLLYATRHRVRNLSNNLRLSLPFFYDPPWQASLPRPPKDQFLPVTEMSARKEVRWDGLDLFSLDPALTYGEFVFQKISKVFPHLVPSTSRPK